MKKGFDLEKWIGEKYICEWENCPRNKEPMTKVYASGRFCSKSCSVASTSQKRSDKLRGKKQKEMQCPYCDFKSVRIGLVRHIQCKHSEKWLYFKKKILKCINNKKELKKLKDLQMKERNFQCPYCDFKSISEKGITTHIRLKHLKEWKIYKEKQLNSFVILTTGNRADDPHTLDITNRQLNEYREKQTVCEICGIARTMISSNLCTDHCHDTMKFRGLLCFKCNTLLGQYEKHRNEIDAYLNKSYYCN